MSLENNYTLLLESYFHLICALVPWWPRQNECLSSFDLVMTLLTFDFGPAFADAWNTLPSLPFSISLPLNNCYSSYALHTHFSKKPSLTLHAIPRLLDVFPGVSMASCTIATIVPNFFVIYLVFSSLFSGL